MVKIQDRIYIDKKDRKLYDEVEFIKGRSRKEQFLLAMSYGYKNNATKKIDKQEGFFLIKDMRPEDEALMFSVALHHFEKIEILADKNKVLNIASEYARAGIKLLHDEVTSSEFGSFDIKLEKELSRILETIKIKK